MLTFLALKTAVGNAEEDESTLLTLATIILIFMKICFSLHLLKDLFVDKVWGLINIYRFQYQDQIP